MGVRGPKYWAKRFREDPTPVAEVPVHELNHRVMAVEDDGLLAKWLEEEKIGAKRRYAMRRIYHRISVLRRRRDLAELDRISKGRVV